MALVDSGKAIGKVTKLLADHLTDQTKLTVKVGRPEKYSTSDVTMLNLFLYEVIFDPSMKNINLDEGRPAPLWLVLKYLLTSYDTGKTQFGTDYDSDCIEAHENLGLGIKALQGLNYLQLNSDTDINTDIIDALQDNPEPLKITFDNVSSELLSKIMQGSDEKYRFSVGFQVRPVMIATSELPSYSLLVGVDYTEKPPEEIGEAGIQIPVIPSMGPKISSISPDKFEINDTLTVYGTDLDLTGLSVRIDSVNLPVTAQQTNLLKCKVDGSIASGTKLSAGSHLISVVQVLPNGRYRVSNPLVGYLLPMIEAVSYIADIPNQEEEEEEEEEEGGGEGGEGGGGEEGGGEEEVHDELKIEGMLLGREQDDIVVALYQDGAIAKMYDNPDHNPEQTQLTFEIKKDDRVSSGTYRVILRVNGQQAKKSPEVEIP